MHKIQRLANMMGTGGGDIHSENKGLGEASTMVWGHIEASTMVWGQRDTLFRLSTMIIYLSYSFLRT